MKTEQIESFCPEDTFALGEKIGRLAEPGTVLTLVGDLGVGKTVFTQGVAAGRGVRGPAQSPTLTKDRIYGGGGGPFFLFVV